MKFTLSKDVFTEGLNQVVNVVSSKTTLPILSNVLIQTENNQIRLTATDLDVTVTGVVPAEVIRPGSVTLPAKKLDSIIKALSGSEVSVDVSENFQASVICGRSKFKINGLSSEDFPELQSFDNASEFTVPQNMLKDGVRRTEYAISTDTTRYVLNGICMIFAEGKMTLVATDGRRLAMVENELEMNNVQPVNAIVPTKAVSEIRRLLGDIGNATVKFTRNQAAFEIGETLVVTKLIDGEYPNFRQVIPADHKERIDLPSQALLETVRRVSILSSDKSVNVVFTFSTDDLEIATTAEGVGEAKESLQIEYKGRQMSVAFNPDFLMAPLKTVGDETVTLYLIDEMSPGVLRCGGEFLYVLMPMRTPK